MIRHSLLRAVLLAALAVRFCLPAAGTAAANVNCLKCHAGLTRGKSVHKALNMGCGSCHSRIDAGSVPHRNAGPLEKGLAAQQPDLCYGCHEKDAFSRAVVHGALGMGCTSCHNPHSSKNARLLREPVPGTCWACHDNADFTRTSVHAPVASGQCMACHAAHSSDQMALLRMKPVVVCLQCHHDVAHGTHVTPGPQIAGQAAEPEPQDPKRPGKPLYCGSCHEPHSADSVLLFRFNAQSVQELCVNCHKMD